MSEKNITVEEIEREHMEEVKPGAHWAYVVGVLGISFLLMLALIAWLGASST
jgi:hypothetical protein